MIVILTLILFGKYKIEGTLVLAFCLVGVCFATLQTRDLLQRSTGTARMKDIAQRIQQGSNGFFKIQYRYIAIIAGLVASTIFFGFLFRPMPKRQRQRYDRLDIRNDHHSIFFGWKCLQLRSWLHRPLDFCAHKLKGCVCSAIVIPWGN